MSRLDSTLCIRINRTSHNRWVRRFFRLVSRLGDGLFWYAVMLGILLSQGKAGLLPCLHMAATGLCGTLIYKWLKVKTLRPRPYEVHQDVWLTGIPLDRFSFPSGHALHAVAFCAVALVYYPMLAWLLLPFTALVGMSRVVLGLHYPSDVLAGALIGITLAAFSLVF
ncbi:MAG TPA: phosphatase PAP2 family protein [Methylophilaceae bacterium]|nr:phosphatase PAP2 family protein [Methylophilaceae bacterium]